MFSYRRQHSASVHLVVVGDTDQAGGRSDHALQEPVEPKEVGGADAVGQAESVADGQPRFVVRIAEPQHALKDVSDDALLGVRVKEGGWLADQELHDHQDAGRPDQVERAPVWPEEALVQLAIAAARWMQQVPDELSGGPPLVP